MKSKYTQFMIGFMVGTYFGRSIIRAIITAGKSFAESD